MLKEISRTVSLLVVLAAIGSISTDSPSPVFARPPLSPQPGLVGMATAEIGIVQLITPTVTATATETPTSTPTSTPTKPPTKTRLPIFPTKTSTPKPAETKTIANPTKLELNNSAEIYLQPMASTTISIGIKAGDNKLILKSDVPLDEKTLGIYGPEQSLVGSGNRCPRTVLQSNPDCQLFYQGGHWGQDGWKAKVTNLSSLPLKATLQFEGTNAGAKGCYSYWEYIGTDRVYWTECQKGN